MYSLRAQIPENLENAQADIGHRIKETNAIMKLQRIELFINCLLPEYADNKIT